MFQLMSRLFNTLGYIIVMAFFFTRFHGSEKILSGEKQTKKDVFLFTLFFSGLAILGTYIGTDYKGAVVNSRNLGMVVGGMLSGPKVAIISGIIAGVHRFFINPNSITTIPCAVATLCGGFITAGLFKKVKGGNRSFLGFLAGILVENLSMMLILIFANGSELSRDIIKNIYLPMVLINGVGAGIIIILTEEILEKKDKEAGAQAKLALEIANKTLPFFRKGESLDEVCKIVMDSLGAEIVVITDREKVLANWAISKKLGVKNRNIQSESTKKVLANGEVMIIDNWASRSEYNCPVEGTKSGIIAPLFQDEKVSGTLKIYFNNEESITAQKKYLAIGLSQLISTQLEISKLENLKAMARDAELKVLQNQINPHFLFNSLHAIAAFLRFDPGKAREMIIDLSTYLRYNLENSDRLVPLEKELEQVWAYINIEKSRFPDKFNVFYNVEKNLENIKIPSLTIQPLVENSLKHGIFKRNEKGNVKITIEKNG
ncbi:MAG: LytS/YhcK type 5TM receptor domain-containing protein, partial [Fusobacteriaceae bacterium]